MNKTIYPNRNCKLCYGMGFYNFIPCDKVETELDHYSRKSKITNQVETPIKTHCKCLNAAFKKAKIKDNNILDNKDGVYKDIKDKYGISQVVIEITEKKLVEVKDEEREATTD